MFASSPNLPVVVTSAIVTSIDGRLSLAGLKDLAFEVFDRMQRDWWATAWWGAVWTCGFIVTFLLLRMLFTRWGDRNVMTKTLALSLLVHVLGGMLSTEFMFGPGLAQEAESDEGISIRNVLVEGPASDGDSPFGNESRAAAAGGALPGTSPAWERTPDFASQPPARIDRPSPDDAAVVPVPQKHNEGAEALALPAPDLAERREDDNPLPERATAKLNLPVGQLPSPIAEETADSRPEAKLGPAAARGTQAAPATASLEAARGVRTEIASERSIERDGLGSGDRASDSDMQPQVARDSEARKGRPLSGSPATTAIGAEGEFDPATSTAAGSGKTSSRNRPFARGGGPSQKMMESANRERTRSGAGRPDGSVTSSADESGNSIKETDGASGGLVALSPSRGRSDTDGLTPNVIRSDTEGAIGKNSGKVPATYRLRTSPARKKIALDMGANEDSERAVEASLQWLANHQNPEGFWEAIESTLGKEPDPAISFSNLAERERSGFQSETGLTSLAVLAFLGKGYTHEDNPFAENVERALRWLVSQQDSKGFLGGRSNRYARMYCHGMATIALGEAYGMTKDPTLREPLVRAVQFIVEAQYPDGSWRYTDWRKLKDPEGDMSLFGWQLMALKSARTAGLAVPQSAMKRAIDYLIDQGEDLKRRGLTQHGGLAAYRRRDSESPKPSMTAESLFCKQMLGIKRTNRASIEAADYLLKHLPQRSKQDLYYWYYGTLAMYHHGGEAWRRWNQALRDNLVADQRTDGDFAGSWNPRAPWGDYGGRVFSTSLSTLCLEVYYRFLPLYQAEDASQLEQNAGK